MEVVINILHLKNVVSKKHICFVDYYFSNFRFFTKLACISMRLHWLSIYYVKYLFSLDCTGVTNQTQTIFLEQLFCTAFEYHDWFNTQTHPKDANENEIESKLIFQPLQTGHLSEWIKSTSTQQEQQSSSSSSLPNQPANRWWVQLQTSKRMAQVQPRKIIMNNRQKYTKITQFQVPSNWASTAHSSLKTSFLLFFRPARTGHTLTFVGSRGLLSSGGKSLSATAHRQTMNGFHPLNFRLLVSLPEVIHQSASPFGYIGFVLRVFFCLRLIPLTRKLNSLLLKDFQKRVSLFLILKMN